MSKRRLPDFLQYVPKVSTNQSLVDRDVPGSKIGTKSNPLHVFDELPAEGGRQHLSSGRSSSLSQTKIISSSNSRNSSSIVPISKKDSPTYEDNVSMRKLRSNKPSLVFLDLPIEMFIQAAAFLSLRDMAVVSQVHRAFSSLGLSTLLSELGSLDFSYTPALFRIAAISNNYSSSSNSSNVCSSGGLCGIEANSEALIRFLTTQPLPKVTHLEFGCLILQPELIDCLKETCPDISRVRMQLNWLNPAGSLCKFLSSFNLKHLFLDFQQITAQSQNGLIWNEILQALRCKGNNQETLEASDRKESSRLESLFLTGAVFTSALGRVGQVLQSCSSLRELRIEDKSKETMPAHLCSLWSLERLEHLSLHGMTLPDRLMMDILKLPKLQSLSVEYASVGACFEHVGSVPQLRSLSVRTPLTVSDLKAIGTASSNLLQLSLRASQAVAGGAAEVLSSSRYFPSLTDLKLKHSQITDLTFTKHFRSLGLRSLIRLSIPASSASSLGDDAMRWISQHCYDLRFLNISRHTRITDSGVSELKQCRRLQSVIMVDCSATVQGVLSLCEIQDKVPSLRYVKVSAAGLLHRASSEQGVSLQTYKTWSREKQVDWCNALEISGESASKGIIRLCIVSRGSKRPLSSPPQPKDSVSSGSVSTASCTGASLNRSRQNIQNSAVTKRFC